MKNTVDCVLSNSSAISSALRSRISLLVCRMVRVLPAIIRVKAIKSYLHVNFSPRKQIAKSELETIAVAELHDNRTISAKGRTTIKK